MFLLVSSILGIFGIAHDTRSLKLHVVPGFPCVQHESLNHHVVTQDSTRRVLSFFCAKLLITSAIIVDLFGAVKTCFVMQEIRNEVSVFSSVAILAQAISCSKSHCDFRCG